MVPVIGKPKTALRDKGWWTDGRKDVGDASLNPKICREETVGSMGDGIVAEALGSLKWIREKAVSRKDACSFLESQFSLQIRSETIHRVWASTPLGVHIHIAISQLRI